MFLFPRQLSAIAIICVALLVSAAQVSAILSARQAGEDSQKAAQALAISEANEKARDAERKVADESIMQSAKAAKEIENAKSKADNMRRAAADRNRAGAASGVRKPAPADQVQPAEVPAAAAGNSGACTDSDEFRRLESAAVGVAQNADLAVIRLNACIALYEAARKAQDAEPQQ